MRAATFLLVGVIMNGLIIAPGWAGNAGDSHSDHTLKCGIATFVISTDRKDSTVTAQRMSMWVSDQHRLAIDLSARRVRQYDDGIASDGLTGIVEDWKCRTTRHHQFLELLYACNQDMSDADVDRYCPATREWTSYVTLTGLVLDRGYKPDDLRYGKLERDLGLPDTIGPKATVDVMTPVD